MQELSVTRTPFSIEEENLTYRLEYISPNSRSTELFRITILPFSHVTCLSRVGPTYRSNKNLIDIKYCHA
jgi:hypothetical protein